jgi:hypothetical protein
LAKDIVRRARGKLFYDPATINLRAGILKAGVAREATSRPVDELNGSAEDFAVSGFPVHLFPGAAPDRNVCSCVIHPIGSNGRVMTAGRLEVFRKLNGTYRVLVTVSDEEQLRRRFRFDEERERAAHIRAYESEVSHVPEGLRRCVEEMQEQGRGTNEILRLIEERFEEDDDEGIRNLVKRCARLLIKARVERDLIAANAALQPFMLGGK